MVRSFIQLILSFYNLSVNSPSASLGTKSISRMNLLRRTQRDLYLVFGSYPNHPLTPSWIGWSLDDPQEQGVLARGEIDLFTYSCRPWSRYIIVPESSSRHISALLRHLIFASPINHQRVYMLKISSNSLCVNNAFLCKAGFMHQDRCVYEPVHDHRSVAESLA